MIEDNGNELGESSRHGGMLIWAAIVAVVYGMLQQPQYIPVEMRIVGGIMIGFLTFAVAAGVAFMFHLFKLQWHKAFVWTFALLLVFSVYGDLKKPRMERPWYLPKCEFGDC